MTDYHVYCDTFRADDLSKGCYHWILLHPSSSVGEANLFIINTLLINIKIHRIIKLLNYNGLSSC